MIIDITLKTQFEIDRDVNPQLFDRRIAKRGAQIFLRYKRIGE